MPNMENAIRSMRAKRRNERGERPPSKMGNMPVRMSGPAYRASQSSPIGTKMMVGKLSPETMRNMMKRKKKLNPKGGV